MVCHLMGEILFRIYVRFLFFLDASGTLPRFHMVLYLNGFNVNSQTRYVECRYTFSVNYSIFFTICFNDFIYVFIYSPPNKIDLWEELKIMSKYTILEWCISCQYYFFHLFLSPCLLCWLLSWLVQSKHRSRENILEVAMFPINPHSNVSWTCLNSPSSQQPLWLTTDLLLFFFSTWQLPW